jgi:hypothetical protein
MKKLILSLVVLFLLAGCKKAIENVKQDLVMQAMTDGQWIITNFVRNGTTITTEFNGYKFQYYSNKTVDAIKIGIVETSGTWDGDAAAMTTSANFPSASTPLSHINGVWHIVDNSWTYVIASQSIGSETKTMRLDKL